VLKQAADLFTKANAKENFWFVLKILCKKAERQRGRYVEIILHQWQPSSQVTSFFVAGLLWCVTSERPLEK
jgi:hypothetical protein